MALVAFNSAGFNVDDYTGVCQPAFQVFFKVVAQLVGFFHTGILRHYQVEVYKALVTRLACAQFMEADDLPGVFIQAGLYFTLFRFRQPVIHQAGKRPLYYAAG
jgi:hypothetical protein